MKTAKKFIKAIDAAERATLSAKEAQPFHEVLAEPDDELSVQVFLKIAENGRLVLEFNEDYSRENLDKDAAIAMARWILDTYEA